MCRPERLVSSLPVSALTGNRAVEPRSHFDPYTLAVTFRVRSLFFFNDTATTEIYTLSLHDALPISPSPKKAQATCFVPRYCADHAAPAAIGRCAPTMAYEPITPCATLVRCIEPPLPFIRPHCRPINSPSTDNIGAPRASV